jgi:class 3 adenylate cyclase/tetratricopeptide (TPR) repeat protein
MTCATNNRGVIMQGTGIQSLLRFILFFDIIQSTRRDAEARRQGEAEDLAHRAHKRRYRETCYEVFRQCGCRFQKWKGDGVAGWLGDGGLVIFDDYLRGVEALLEVKERLEATNLWDRFPTRFGADIGFVEEEAEGDIAGSDVNLAQRIMATAGDEPRIMLSRALADKIHPYFSHPSYCLRDAHERQAKGFDEKVAVWELTGPGLPGHPLPPEEKGNLSEPLEEIVGRQRAQEEMECFLTSSPKRCVTLTGSTGVGKTFLASAMAWKLKANFPGGVWMVSLTDIKDCGSLLMRLADTLHIAMEPQISETNLLPMLTQRLQQRVKGQRTLLVLDNFESLLHAQDSPSHGLKSAQEARNIVSALLKLPVLHLLITSQQRLEIPEEQILTLELLEVPAEGASLATIQATESMRLLEMCARASDSRFCLTQENTAQAAEICRRLGGLPLGIKIIAEQLGYRLPGDLLTEMQSQMLEYPSPGLEERHRSLMAAFSTACRTLQPEYRELLEQLTLLETAFSWQQAKAICTIQNVDAGLIALLKKSLLQFDHDNARRPYSLLPPIREYARNYLEAPSEQSRRNFAATFTRLACSLRNAYADNALPEALAEIRFNLANFGAAWQIVRERDEPEMRADLGVAVTFFAPLLPEAAGLENWLDAIEETVEQRADPARAGILWNTRARLASRRKDYTEAIRCQKQALNCFLCTPTRTKLADAQTTLALFAFHAGEKESAEKYARLGVETARQSEDRGAEALGLCLIATLCAEREPNEAEALAQRGLDLFQEQQDRGGQIHALRALATVAEQRGDYDRAEDCLCQTLQLSREMQSPIHLTRSLEAAAQFYERRNIEEPVRLLKDLAAAVLEFREGWTILQKERGINTLTTIEISLPTLYRTLKDFHSDT